MNGLLGALLLAHLVADYPLQADYMVDGKPDDWFALASHVAVHGWTTLIAVWVVTGEPTTTLWAFLLAFVSHWLIDTAELHIRWDQTAHLGALLAIWMWLA